MGKKIACLLVLLQLLYLPLYAQDYNAIKDYNALDKLSRGASNLTLSVVEIPRQMIRVKQKQGPVSGDIAGVFLGSLKGVGCFIGRTAIGVYEVATFFMPSYKPIVKPEYIFSEDEEE